MNKKSETSFLRKNYSFLRALFVKRKIWLFLLLFLFGTSNLFSQLKTISRLEADYPEAVRTIECNTSPYVGCIITLQPATVGINYVFDVKLNESTIASFNPSFDYIPCSGTGDPTYSFNSVTSILTITIPAARICTSDPAFANNHIDVRVEVEGETLGLDDQIFRIPLPRDPVKIAMVLDISGSMILPTPGDDVDHTSRWDVLKVGVNTFMEKLEALRHPLDSLALTYFTTYTIQPVFPTVKNFIGITPSGFIPATSSSSYIVNTDLNLPSRYPLYTTAMGLGLLEGKAKLRGNIPAPDGSKKIVLLFTDGLQNVWPRVSTVDGITLEDGNKLNDCTPPPCTTDQVIRYFTISMGAGPEVPEILNTIAVNNSGAAHNSTVGDMTELASFFSNQWVSMLNSSSPQIVSNKIGNMVSGGINHKFVINKNIKTILFELISKESNNITIDVAKDGDTLIPVINKYDSNHKLIGFNLPFSHQNTNKYSSGTWDVTLKGGSGKKYMLSCFVDDHFLNYDFKVNKSIFTVGDSIRFSGKLDYAEKPLSGGNIKVEAIVFRPGDDLGNLLSTYLTPDSIHLNDVEDPAQQKFQNLLANDSSFYHSLLPQEQIIELTADNTGLFTGSFSKTELCGVYKIVYVLSGEIPMNGSFERTKTSEAIFVFGNVVQETPVVVPNPNAMPDSAKYKNLTVVKIKPKNKFGYLMGPGFKSKINVTINPARKKISSASLLPVQDEAGVPFVKEITDNLDGSYYIYVANVPKFSNPKIQINVRGEKLYNGKLFPVPCWVNILLIILIVLLLLSRYFKFKNASIYKILLWIISLIALLIVLLQYFGIVRIF